MSAAMGNAQLLTGDAMLVGWGTQPYVTEFGPTGDVRFDAKFDGGAGTTARSETRGSAQPETKPAVAASRHAGDVKVYASWNGSTETAAWRVAAGAAPGALAPVATAAARGFETAIQIAAAPRFVSVTALDHRHRTLGASRVVPVRA